MRNIVHCLVISLLLVATTRAAIADEMNGFQDHGMSMLQSVVADSAGFDVVYQSTSSGGIELREYQGSTRICTYALTALPTGYSAYGHPVGYSDGSGTDVLVVPTKSSTGTIGYHALTVTPVGVDDCRDAANNWVALPSTNVVFSSGPNITYWNQTGYHFVVPVRNGGGLGTDVQHVMYTTSSSGSTWSSWDTSSVPALSGNDGFKSSIAAAVFNGNLEFLGISYNAISQTFSLQRVENSSLTWGASWTATSMPSGVFPAGTVAAVGGTLSSTPTLWVAFTDTNSQTWYNVLQTTWSGWSHLNPIVSGDTTLHPSLGFVRTWGTDKAGIGSVDFDSGTNTYIPYVSAFGSGTFGSWVGLGSAL